MDLGATILTTKVNDPLSMRTSVRRSLPAMPRPIRAGTKAERPVRHGWLFGCSMRKVDRCEPPGKSLSGGIWKFLDRLARRIWMMRMRRTLASQARLAAGKRRGAALSSPFRVAPGLFAAVDRRRPANALPISLGSTPIGLMITPCDVMRKVVALALASDVLSLIEESPPLQHQETCVDCEDKLSQRTVV